MKAQPTVVARVDHGARVIIEHDYLIGLGIPRVIAAHVVAAAALRVVQDYNTHEPMIEVSNNVALQCRNAEHARVVADTINAYPSFAVIIQSALAVLGCVPS